MPECAPGWPRDLASKSTTHRPVSLGSTKSDAGSASSLSGPSVAQISGVVRELIRDINDFTQHYTPNSRSCVWTAPADFHLSEAQQTLVTYFGDTTLKAYKVCTCLLVIQRPSQCWLHLHIQRYADRRIGLRPTGRCDHHLIATR
jgi:hypothetical protein